MTDDIKTVIIICIAAVISLSLVTSCAKTMGNNTKELEQSYIKEGYIQHKDGTSTLWVKEDSCSTVE